MSDPFEAWIESELQGHLGAILSAPAPAGAPIYAAALGGPMGLGSTIAAMATSKAVTGTALALLAAGVAGGGAEAAITGSADPTVWGQQVKEQVQDCKEALTGGHHGIGDCVSAFAKQHGPATAAEHRASPARTDHPKGPPSSRPSPHGPASGQPSPAGAPPATRPSPGGPPATRPSPR